MDNELADRIVLEARRWIGTPYRHRAAVRGVGCDCLGLVRGIWRAVYGEEPEAMPLYSADWAEATGGEPLLNAARRHMRARRPAEMQPGDMLLFRWRPQLPAKHVGILMPPAAGGGEARLLHAYETAGKVTEGALVPAWRNRIVAVFAFPAIGGTGG